MSRLCLIKVLVFVLVVRLGTLTYAIPVEFNSNVNVNATETNSVQEAETASNVVVITPATTVAPPQTTAIAITQPETEKEHEVDDLETAASEEKENAYIGSVVTVPEDTGAPGGHFDPAVYASLLTPEAFQQYANQFGAAAAAYVPYAAYPAPIGYGVPAAPPPIYPSPYVVQTGYEGYLVPTTASTSTSTDSTTSTTTDSTTSSTSTTTAATDTTTAATTTNNPLAFLGNLFNAIMMSNLFRVLAAVVSGIGMLFFGGNIFNAICNLTPICDISLNTVTYLRHRGTAENVGRMIAEEITPERVRRATEFVRNAIRKYREMQKFVNENEAYKRVVN